MSSVSHPSDVFTVLFSLVSGCPMWGSPAFSFPEGAPFEGSLLFNPVSAPPGSSHPAPVRIVVTPIGMSRRVTSTPACIRKPHAFRVTVAPLWRAPGSVRQSIEAPIRSTPLEWGISGFGGWLESTTTYVPSGKRISSCRNDVSQVAPSVRRGVAPPPRSLLLTFSISRSTRIISEFEGPWLPTEGHGRRVIIIDWSVPFSARWLEGANTCISWSVAA